MNIIVDGESEPLALVDTPSSAIEAIAMASDILRAKGRAIMSVTVDGKDIPHTSLAIELEKAPIDTIQIINLSTKELSTLVNEAVTELEENIPELPKACHELAAVFQGEDALSGFTPFQEIAAIWQHIKTRELQIASALDIELSEQTIHGKSLEDHHDELNGFLSESIQAMEARDTVLLGDLLEYELAPRAELETEVVALLKKIASEQRSGA